MTQLAFPDVSFYFQPLAEGRKCASCKLGSFGLSSENPEGCFQCFCFGRSSSCRQGTHSWTQVVMPGERLLAIGRGNSRLERSQGLILVPDYDDDSRSVRVGVESIFTAPLYWSLPKTFLGDKVASYNGFLRFQTWSNGPRPYSPDVLQVVVLIELAEHIDLMFLFMLYGQEFPLVQLQSHDRIVLEHFPRRQSASDGRYEVRLHEEEWVEKGARHLPATREVLMVALQGLERVLVRAGDRMESTQAKLKGVALDVGMETESGLSRPAVGVETCDCPPEYSGSSCQNPGRGHYRWHRAQYQATTEEIMLVHLAGEARPCKCNGRAEQCHPETGKCMVRKQCFSCSRPFQFSPALVFPSHMLLLDYFTRFLRSSYPLVCIDCILFLNYRFPQNCRENTSGDHCDLCSLGHYGDPARGVPCRACQCPSEEKNFARTCSVNLRGEFSCQCRDGYTGPKCQR